MKHFFLLIGLGVFPALSSAVAGDDMKAFPLAESGSVRYVLNVPKQANEENFKLELQVGQTVQVDAVNRCFFGGKIEEETITGWGYPRYLVKALGPMAGTLMAADPKAPKKSRFVTLGGDPYLIRYNSRLPVVIYVPEGAEVRYRIWRADKALKTMSPG